MSIKNFNEFLNEEFEFNPDKPKFSKVEAKKRMLPYRVNRDTGQIFKHDKHIGYYSEDPDFPMYWFSFTDEIRDADKSLAREFHKGCGTNPDGTLNLDKGDGEKCSMVNALLYAEDKRLI